MYNPMLGTDQHDSNAWNTPSRGFGPHAPGRCTLGLVLFAILIALPALLNPHASNTTRQVPAFEVADNKMIFLRPLGDLYERDIDALARNLERRVGTPVVLLPPMALPEATLDPTTGQYHAGQLLDWLFATRPDDAWRYMAITREPIQTGDDHTLYGYANAADHVALLTTYHFQTGLSSDNLELRALAIDRMSRAALHELAHTLGMNHCHTQGCLMQGVIPIDRLTPRTTLCTRCVTTLSENLAEPRQMFADTLDLGDSFFYRGFHEQALDQYHLAHQQAQKHTAPITARKRAMIENRIGAALMSTGRVVEGEQHIATALKLDSSYAQAHYNLAIVRAYAGETHKARTLVHRGMLLDPDPISQHEFAGRFFLEILDEPNAALSYLQEYARLGGENIYLLNELEQLEQPEQITFENTEVDVIHGR